MFRQWLLIATTAITTSAPCDVAAWRSSLEAYWREYPKSEAQDLYKFAHQGILGSEHAVTDVAGVSAWMRREVAELPQRSEPGPHRAPLTEPLPPTGKYVRVHLRPFLAQQGDTAALVRAFIATANAPRGDTAQFACAERALAAMAEKQFAATWVMTLIRAQRPKGFGAVHHSDVFEKAYAPAYRVVTAAWFAEWSRTVRSPKQR